MPPYWLPWRWRPSRPWSQILGLREGPVALAALDARETPPLPLRPARRRLREVPTRRRHKPVRPAAERVVVAAAGRQVRDSAAVKVTTPWRDGRCRIPNRI